MTLLPRLLLLGALAIAQPLNAQDARGNLTIEPAQLFPAMLSLAAREDWAQMDKALDILGPLMAEVDAVNASHPGDALASAVATRSPEEVRASVLKFVAAAVSDLLARASVDPSPSSRRDTIRVAFAELVSVSSILKPLSFELHQQAERGFRTAYAQSTGDAQRFAASCDALITILARVGDGR